MSALYASSIAAQIFFFFLRKSLIQKINEELAA